MADPLLTHADEGLTGMAPDPDSREAGNSKRALFRRLKRDVITDLRNSAEWRREARENYDMFAGKQWSKAEEGDISDSGKVPIIFNRILSVIKAVAGHEINNRHVQKFFPRGVEDTAANEVLNAASKWMGDICDAEDEESDAFEDTTICGMGWTEHFLSYDEDREGKYQEVRTDPLEMAWDSSAKRKNIVDAERIHRIRRDVKVTKARQMFPGKHDIELDASWVIGESDGQDPVPIEERREHRSGLSEGPGFGEEKKITLVETQWWEHEPYYLVAAGGEPIEMDASKFQTFKTRAKDIGFAFESIRLQRKVFHRAFLGATGILEQHESPAGNSFTYTCITGERDRNAKKWFGLVQVMKDPQKFSNKWLSNTLHILDTTAKGGLMAEEDAFEDQRQAEDSWAQPDAITWLKKKALQENKIKEKTAGQFPVGYFQLSQVASSAVLDVVGINLEFLGMVDRNQPGILEAQRKQAAVTILATLFNNLRRFRKGVGRIRLHFIQNYMSDGRLVRVVGPMGAKSVPLVKDKTLGRYDVVIDESTSGINQKAETWAILTSILPLIKEFITPEILMLVLKYSPLPASLLAEIEAMVTEGGEDPQAEQQRKMITQQIVTALEKDKASTAKDQASAQKLTAEAAKTVAETEQMGTVIDPKVQDLLRMVGEAGGAQAA